MAFTSFPSDHASMKLGQNELFFKQVKSGIVHSNVKHIKVKMNDAHAAKRYSFVSMVGNMKERDSTSTRTTTQNVTDIKGTPVVFELKVTKSEESSEDVYELPSTSFRSRVLNEYHGEMPGPPIMEPGVQTEEEEEEKKDDDLTEREEMLQYIRKCGVYGLVMHEKTSEKVP